jgi:flagellar biosynthesis protein FlhG
MAAGIRADAGIDRDCAHLVKVLGRTPLDKDPFLRNLAGLLLFSTAFYRLSSVKSVFDLFYRFFPRRKTASGALVRDRYTQIRSFFENDKSYHDRYFTLIKTLFPVVMKQVSSVAEALRATGLLFAGSDGNPDRNIYLRLLMDTVHDTVHSGLGVFPVSASTPELRL